MTLILSGTDGLSDVDGSAATPAIRGTDANTGIFFPAADQVAITTGGTQRAVVDASGNVGIGTSSPAQRLHIAQAGQPKIEFEDTTNSSKGRITSGGSTGSMTFDADPDNAKAGSVMTFNVDASERMRIDSSGNVGIGTSSPAGKLQVLSASGVQRIISEVTGTTGSDSAQIRTVNGAVVTQMESYSTTGLGYVGTASAHSFAFLSSGAERARINSSGNFMVGTTDANPTTGSGIKSEPGTNPRFSIVTASSTTATALSIYSTGAADYRFFVDPDGKIYATFTTIGAISDQRLKENIQDLDVGLDAVMALKPRKFDWREGKGKNIKGDRGWIAQEFEQVFPDMIDEWKDESPEGEDPYKSVRADLIPVLVKAIQEQQALITQLQADVAALKGASA